MPRPTQAEIERDVRHAFDELDYQQLAVLKRLTPERRLQIMFELCEFMHNAIIAYERQRAPDISDEELAARVRRHINLKYAAKKSA